MHAYTCVTTYLNIISHSTCATYVVQYIQLYTIYEIVIHLKNWYSPISIFLLYMIIQSAVSSSQSYSLISKSLLGEDFLPWDVPF